MKKNIYYKIEVYDKLTNGKYKWIPVNSGLVTKPTNKNVIDFLNHFGLKPIRYRTIKIEEKRTLVN